MFSFFQARRKRREVKKERFLKQNRGGIFLFCWAQRLSYPILMFCLMFLRWSWMDANDWMSFLNLWGKHYAALDIRMLSASLFCLGGTRCSLSTLHILFLGGWMGWGLDGLDDR